VPFSIKKNLFEMERRPFIEVLIKFGIKKCKKNALDSVDVSALGEQGGTFITTTGW